MQANIISCTLVIRRYIEQIIHDSHLPAYVGIFHLDRKFVRVRRVEKKICYAVYVLCTSFAKILWFKDTRKHQVDWINKMYKARKRVFYIMFTISEWHHNTDPISTRPLNKCLPRNYLSSKSKPWKTRNRLKNMLMPNE